MIMARFRRELRPFQRYRVRTRCAGWSDKSLFFEHTVETQAKGQDGKPSVFVNAQGFSQVKLTKKSPFTWVEALKEFGEDVDLDTDRERLSDGLRAIMAYEDWSSSDILMRTTSGTSTNGENALQELLPLD